MIKLEIKNSDGSHYWTDHFKSMPEAIEWYATEQTRNYWKPDRIAEFFDLTPPEPTKAEKDEKQAKIAKKNLAIERIKLLTASDLDTVAKIKGAFIDLIDALNLKD